MPYLKNADMTMEQVQKFVNQVKKKNIRLGHVNILGGEPFLHPRLSDFISLIFYELMVPGKLSHIYLNTNGIIHPDKALEDCKRDPNIRNAFHDQRIQCFVSPQESEKTFTHVLSAPVDLGLKWEVCGAPRGCGILLNTYGYWPGGVCGQIARLFGRTEYIRHDFPIKFKKTWPRLKKDICKYCSTGSKELWKKTEGRITPSYKKAIRQWMKGEFSIPKNF